MCGTRTSKREYLDIRPLEGWRQAVMKVPPIFQIMFDLSLPKKEEDERRTSVADILWQQSYATKAGSTCHIVS